MEYAAIGRSQDDTLERVRSIGDPKIRIIETAWNEHMTDRGFVYAPQKMIAQYACTGEWAFYLEGDVLVHELELERIRASVARHHVNPTVEALVFYSHFYGVPGQIATSPAWYRRECRLIRNTIRSYAPDGQCWLVTSRHRRPHYPRAALANAHVYHYGHVRKLSYMQQKVRQVSKYWGKIAPEHDYGRIDPLALSPFTGTHPTVIQDWLTTEAEQCFALNPEHRLTSRERKHCLSMKLERAFGVDLSHKHYRLVA